MLFGGSRTFARIDVAIEDAGFEIRDTIMWLYGSGFPKSMNIGLAIDKKMGVESIDTGIQSPNARPNSDKSNTLYESGTVGKDFTIKKATNQWDGWGTSLKPAYEPIIVARKPVENSIIDNVMKYGVGGINIDECRVPAKQGEYDIRHYTNEDCFQNLKPKESKFQVEPQPDGRFPANVILTYDDTDYDEVCGGMPYTKSGSEKTFGSVRKAQEDNLYQLGIRKKENSGQYAPDNYGDEGNASRYFYCAKASKFDREEGLENEDKFNPIPRKNIHPTVKPTDLMKYLVRLVSPKGATILDVFNGSGSTGKAVMLENKERNADYKYIGVELSEEYCEISKARIEYIINNDFDFWKDENGRTQHEKVKKDNKLTIFDFEVEE